MKKVWMITAALLLASGAGLDVSAQIRPGAPRIDAQVRRNRLPGRGGVSRPPIGIPQIRRTRPLNPNQLKKQQLQQRVMQALGIRPEQRMRMQEIRRSHDDQIISAGRRLRLARQALDRAIMSEPYNEAEVRRATDELAAAQADKVRIDASVRAQVRNVLTPEQVLRFHQLEREMRREMRQQRVEEREQDRQGAGKVSESEEIDLTALLLLIR